MVSKFCCKKSKFAKKIEICTESKFSKKKWKFAKKIDEKTDENDFHWFLSNFDVLVKFRFLANISIFSRNFYLLALNFRFLGPKWKYYKTKTGAGIGASTSEVRSTLFSTFATFVGLRLYHFNDYYYTWNTLWQAKR